MNSASRGLMVLVVLAPLGLWGCSQDKNETPNKVKDLAARNAKLEEDHKAAVSAAEGLRKKLAQAEAKRAELAKQVEVLGEVTGERDELRKQVSTRTGERDALHAQMVQFGKELQSLAGKIEAAASQPTPSATTATAHSNP